MLDNKDYLKEEIVNRFVEVLTTNGNNPVYALDTLDYEIFILNKDKFWNLDENSQWTVRNILDALNKVYK